MQLPLRDVARAVARVTPYTSALSDIGMGAGLNPHVRRDGGQVDIRKRPGQRLNHLGVELRPGASPQLAKAFRRRAGRPIRARTGHRVEGVGDVNDAGDERNLGAVKAVRVALAVGTLVMQFDNRDVRLEELDAAQDPRTHAGCCLIDSYSSAVSGPGFIST